MKATHYLKFGPEVRSALDNGAPIVALESTIISHGMPYPDNLHTAIAVEEIIRAAGAVPATIGIIDGEIVVGMTAEQLDVMATCDDVAKSRIKDIPYILATGGVGATTVSATMAIAEQAGIEVFVTGGIGGVHRDVANNWDISSDLTQLATSKVAVVCAGVKSILDIDKTLEHLETLGVPIIGLNSAAFPAFFLPDSGHQVDYHLEDLNKAAEVVRVGWESGFNRGGALLTSAVPADEALDPALWETVLERAEADLKTAKIIGKAVTPFLLDRIKELTNGASLKTNIALIKNNARYGAQLAMALKDRP